MPDKTYEVIGVMSGTSVDGLDLAFCRFEHKGNIWKYSIPHSKNIPYSKDWQEKLLNIISKPAEKILITDVEFGEYIADQINLFITEFKLDPILIASHGHTVFHQPANKISLQIGNGFSINAETGITTITDFRQLDVILGGQGAPLVPLGDQMLFPEYNVCLNIGGFSNISYESNDRRLACDIGPANIVLNRLSRNLGLKYDDRGTVARSGDLIEELFKKLNSIEYYKRPSPKSLSLEWVNKNFMPLLDGYKNTADILNTLTRHISYQIINSILQISFNKNREIKVLVTGGGAYNEYLMELIRQKGGDRITFEIPDHVLVDFKESLIFAFLGLLRFKGEINTLKSVTGSREDSMGGIIHDNCTS